MSQWNRLHWKEEHCVIGGIVLRPQTQDDGSMKIDSSHNLQFSKHRHYPDCDAEGFHQLDWSKEAAKHPETGEQMHHVGNGVVDHITVHPVKRGTAISVHAVWRDKDGNPTGRQDAHFQYGE